MHPKQNQKQITCEEINYACFKVEEKASRSVKNNNNFINIIRDKFTISIH